MIEKALAIIFAVSFTWLLPPLLDGIGRKIKAKVQGRKGATILQTYYDLFSLLRIRSVAPTRSALFFLSPYLAFSSVIASSLVLPFGCFPISFSWDIFVLIYVAGITSVSLMLSGFSLNNIYANIGANREMSILLSLEPILGISIAIFALNSHSTSIYGILNGIKPSFSLLFSYTLLGYVAYLEGGFLPYDAPEAETEILEGPLCEYSGRLLGIFKASLMSKRFIFLWLLSSFLVIPWFRPPLPAIQRFFLILFIQLLLTFAIYSSFVFIESMAARKKTREIVEENWKVFWIGAIGLFLAGVGWR